MRSRQDLIEADYLHKLSDKEKEWLNKFNGEYVNAAFDTKNPRNNIHKTKKYRKKSYDANNARNRCIYTKARMSGNLLSLDEALNEDEMGSDFNVGNDTPDKSGGGESDSGNL